MLTIYKASAGSGKTFKLTQQFLTYLLGEKDTSGKWHPAHGHNRHRRILAITFTNKATAEMKSRIIENLSRLSGNGKRSDHVEHLTKTLGIDEDTLRHLSQRALNEILFDYQNFNVSTIDTFFQQVLRSLAYELDHPGDFSLEIEQTNVVNEGVRRLMSAFNGPEYRGNIFESTLKGMMDKRATDGKNSSIFGKYSSVYSTIKDATTTLFDERFKLIGNMIMAWLHDDNLRKGMKATLEDQKDSIMLSLKKYCDRIKSKHADIWQYTSATFVKNPIDKRFITGDFPKYDDLKKQETYRQWINPDPSKFLTKAGRERFPDWEMRIYDLVADLRKCLRFMLHHKAIEALINELPKYDFMAEVQKFIDQYRDENGVVVLADTNSIIKQVMNDKDVPFVYEKMAMRLEHFLIDEFQDTSRMQWDNLRPLILNSLSVDNDNLIIGDEKQAIYRFRNSDSSMLGHGIKEDPDFKGRVKEEGNKIEENTNWRTVPEIVKFNNTLFKYLANVVNVPGYDNVEQQIADKNSDLPGYVLFKPFPEIEDDENEKLKLDADGALDDMIENIKRQHDAGYAWNEITVLAPKNEQCECVVRRLQQENIPVATDEALRIDSSPLVRMIISAMQLLYNASSNKKVLTTAAGKQAVFKIHFEYEYARLRNQGTPAKEAMQKATEHVLKLDSTNPVPKPIQAVIDRNPATIIEMAETILRECVLRDWEKDGFTDLNSIDLKPGEKSYMAALCDVIDDYVELNGNDLGAFLSFWENSCDKLTINGAKIENMVSVMTIHKSKGLENECIHIPYVDYALEGKHKEGPVWISRKDAPDLPWSEPDIPGAMLVKLNGYAVHIDSPLYPAYLHDLTERTTDGLNKSYVGFTRPVRELCVYYDYTKDFGKQLADAFEVKFAGAYNQDTHILELGEHTQPVPKQKDANDDKEKEKENDYSPEAKMIQPEKPAPFYAVAYNDAAEGVTRMSATAPGEPEPTVGAEDDEDPRAIALREAADRGDRLHLVLSRVLHSALLKNALYRFKRHLEPGDEDTLREMFSHPDTAQYVERWYKYGTKSVNEVSILGTPDHKEHSKRIDRLVYHPDGSIDVIDFKFTTAENDGHQKQVSEYMNLMRLAHPTATVRGYLWYVDLHRVVEVNA